MATRVGFFVSLCFVLTMTGTVLAQEPVPRHSDNTWSASYWNNTTLSGPSVLTRSEYYLDHDWGWGSPDPRVSSDGFSARWTRSIDVAPGFYRFTATSDDGIRVWVDGDLIIDQWYDHPARTLSVDKYLYAGPHWVMVEFYENRGLSVAKLWWVPAPTPLPFHGWRGEYYNNVTLSGTPALVREDAVQGSDGLDFNWVGDSPAPSIIGTDLFSVRWTRTLDLPAGHYRFSVTVDDGARLWVNGELLIDAWRDQAVQTYTQEKYLPGGAVPIKMEYYENGGNAVAKLSWEFLSPTIRNWRAEYYNNMTLSGTPALVRDDGDPASGGINFNWGHGSPASGVISADQFSARWSRMLDLPEGNYRFVMTVDDGARLWVNGHLLIDAWRDQAAHTYTAGVYVPGGLIPVTMEYYENRGLAVAQLSWTKTGTPWSPGTIIVDDTDPGFVSGGSPTGWHAAFEGYGGHLTWTRNNDRSRPNYNWARWFPFLTRGWYEVFVFIPERYSTTANARYWVVHADGYNLRVVDQSTYGGRWVSLGTYRFDGASNEYVSLSDVTYETRLGQFIAFDAVKWEPR